MKIQPFDLADFDLFISYLNEQLAENGAGESSYFMPFERIDSNVGPDRIEAFRKALSTPLMEPGWRQLWLARSEGNDIIGHVDLRSHPERHAEHRCLLGIGVNRDYRKSGIGTKLIEHSEKWAVEKKLKWIDLDVLSVNLPAVKLYAAMGFSKVGEIPAKFMLDGLLYSETIMTKKLM